MAAGRPPKVYSDEDVIALGEDLISWIRKKYNEKDMPVHLTEWYSLEKDILYPDWDNIRKRKEFLKYYESALDLMVLCTQKNQNLETAYGSRFLGVYSKDLRKHEREVKFEVIDHEAQVKAEANNKNQTSPNDCLLSDLIKAVKESK